MEKSFDEVIQIESRTLDRETTALSELIMKHTVQDGTYHTAIPNVYLNRYSHHHAGHEVLAMHAPFVGIAVSGEKEVTIGDATCRYGGSKIFVSPVALPVILHTTHATLEQPFLGIGLILDPQKISALVLNVFPRGLPHGQSRYQGYLVDADVSLLQALTRLLQCLSDPEEVKLFTPLIMEEILLRLLRSPVGVLIAEMGIVDSTVSRITQAIAWLQENYAQKITISALAGLVHMSVSSFCEHFKAVTSMSAIQYQKAIRLQKARSLMLTKQLEASEACRMVGYVSDSQFSRDYSRLFGNPPIRDIARVLQQK